MAFKFEVEKELGAIQENRNAQGMRMELNLVSFNDRKAKYDIRPWDVKHEMMGKGISLSKEELVKLKEILNSLDLD